LCFSDRHYLSSASVTNEDEFKRRDLLLGSHSGCDVGRCSQRNDGDDVAVWLENLQPIEIVGLDRRQIPRISSDDRNRSITFSVDRDRWLKKI